MLQPIETPMMLSGADPSIFPYMNGIFRSQGVQLVQGGATAALKSATLAHDWKTSLLPGDTVSMVLMSGDINLASGCTVTYNDGSRILICGHAFLNVGPLNMPMAKGEILWTLASQFQPTKVSNAMDVVGTFKQDRHLGMMGVLGEKPRMIPVH